MTARRTDTRLVGFALGLLALLAGGRPALAQPPPATPQLQPGPAPVPAPEEPAVERKWYGAPTLTLDMLALGSLAGAILVSSSDTHGDLADYLGFAGVSGYLVSGPAVHFFEKRYGMSLASLGIRVGAPLAGMPVGILVAAVAAKALTNDPADIGVIAVGIVFGFFGGMLTAVAVDDFALARKPVTAVRTAVAIVPVYRPASRQTGVMLRASW